MNGGQGRNRTADASLFRAALYRLSYLARIVCCRTRNAVRPGRKFFCAKLMNYNKPYDLAQTCSPFFLLIFLLQTCLEPHFQLTPDLPGTAFSTFPCISGLELDYRRQPRSHRPFSAAEKTLRLASHTMLLTNCYYGRRQKRGGLCSSSTCPGLLVTDTNSTIHCFP